MFTGLIEETGMLLTKLRQRGVYSLTIRANLVCDGTKIGDSICVDGVCLTVTVAGRDRFSAEVMDATWNQTTLKRLRVGQALNLERALAVGDRLGGHIVSGHVHGVGVVRKMIKAAGKLELEIQPPPALLKQLTHKGSIAINGVSLTIQKITAGRFTTAIIPHTAKSTTLGTLRIGASVNLETDA